ncbi:MAG: aconitase X catalytic domain-containing protein [bacterium]|nr:aconitase X catalytic domain-containing protein [bacterium]MDE0290375.1 aconitase X catalytic domain-containing protein [bacterium]MDE0437190.1 aconitase X catalytic domain-containing protein [bacterium]
MARPVLDAEDVAMLNGERGAAEAMAMRLLVGLGGATGARRMIDISSAHVDGTLYLGEASLEFATRLRDLGGRVRVPTTLNVSSLDLLHPDLFLGDDTTRRAALATMQAYVDMGGRATWTCAPYQLPERPELGDRVAWGESNAVVFANSVLGARTPRFGDFVDIAAALTGRAPEMGLYLDENRRAGVLFDVSRVPRRALATDELFAVLGIMVGAAAGMTVPVITGLESATEDQMKVLGAAAASSGTVGLIHVVGVTPEARTLAEATAGREPARVNVTPAALDAAYSGLTSTTSGALRTVNLGTPHYSSDQIARLSRLLDGRPVHDRVTFYVNTGRDVLGSASGIGDLEGLGVVFVVDTCTYVTPIIRDLSGVAMTDSAKWAYYAPGNLGLDVVFGSTADCVESAVAGRVMRGSTPW